jgi:hypothetical protein
VDSATIGRIYHAELGRFLTRDPAGYRGSPSNLCEFLSSRPMVMLDPNGLDAFDDSGCESAPPLSTTAGCNVHRGVTLYGFDAGCVCECAGNSNWDNQVRGCLDCAQRKGVPPKEAHLRCYALADAEHRFGGIFSRMDIGIRCHAECAVQRRCGVSHWPRPLP